MKYLETDRLILRAWKDEDKQPFARMNADAVIMEYFPRRLGEKESDHLVDKFEKYFETYGYGPYALEDKKTGQFIGFAGLHHVEMNVPFAPAVEIAWRLDYEYWGKGYATEASQGVLKHAFTKLNLDEVVAFAGHDNERAIHVMEKIGMKRDPKGDFDYPNLPASSPLGKFVLFRIKKKDFVGK